MTPLIIEPLSPYDFELSVRVVRSFASEQQWEPEVYTTAIRVADKPMLLKMRQVSRKPPLIEVRSNRQSSSKELKRTAERLICAELDLHPYYRVTRSHPVLGPIVKALHGLKPIRPASLFEMFVIAITEQQISMTASYHIRQRLVERFGEPVDDLWVFPTAEQLSRATIAELVKCGLSHRKAEYVKGLAERVASGELDLERLQTMPDEEVRALLLEERGLGPWSVDYILVRGMTRPDSVPVDDLGIRTIVGRYLGTGARLTAQGVIRKLAPFKPYRGLAAFYLLAHARLSHVRTFSHLHRGKEQVSQQGGG